MLSGLSAMRCQGRLLVTLATLPRSPNDDPRHMAHVFKSELVFMNVKYVGFGAGVGGPCHVKLRERLVASRARGFLLERHCPPEGVCDGPAMFLRLAALAAVTPVLFYLAPPPVRGFIGGGLTQFSRSPCLFCRPCMASRSLVGGLRHSFAIV